MEQTHYVENIQTQCDTDLSALCKSSESNETCNINKPTDEEFSMSTRTCVTSDLFFVFRYVKDAAGALFIATSLQSDPSVALVIVINQWAPESKGWTV